MKYISLLIVMVFLIFTWKVSTSKKDLSLSEQQRLNEILGEFITKAVQEKVPNATDIKFSKLYTEVIEPGEKMRAHFSFSYSETKTTPTMLEKVAEGTEPAKGNSSFSEDNIKDELRRYRKGSFYITSTDGNQWNAKIEKIDDVKIEFVEPLDVSKEAPAADTKPNEPEKKSETNEPAHH